ncbi:MAG: MmgE/PrpD family protein [Smithellaceae bacterium]
MREFEAIKPEQDPAGKLAEMVINTKYSDIPCEVVDIAKKAIFDTLAVTIAGSGWEVTPQIADLVNHWGGIPESTVLVYGYRVPAPSAAFANGVMARAIDMGDVHELSGHVTEWIVPTLLSAIGMKKEKTTGMDFLIAYIVGAELTVRIGGAIAMAAHTVTGMPGEGAYGPMSCAAAVSRLMGLSVQETWNAMGISYSNHTLGEFQKYAEGTQMARVQHAFAGDTGIKAPLLAQRGVTAPKGIFLGVPGGIFRHLKYDDFYPELLTDDLGKKWLFAGLSLKPFSSCKFTHSFIAATLTLMKEHKLDYREIAGIHCIGSEGARMVFEPREAKWNPTTTAEALFSAPYTVATAAITGGVFLNDFSDEEIKRQNKRELIKKITSALDPEIKTQFEGFTVEISLNNGKKFSNTNDFVLGHPKNPMSWDDVKEKFWKCVPHAAVKMSKDKCERIVEICASLEKMKDMDELVKALTP